MGRALRGYPESRLEWDIRDVLSRLDGIRSSGPNRWMARCPAHSDRTPSLSVRWTGDRVLLYCFAGCSYQDIVNALGLSPSRPSSAGRHYEPIFKEPHHR